MMSFYSLSGRFLECAISTNSYEFLRLTTIQKVKILEIKNFKFALVENFEVRIFELIFKIT